MKKAFINGKIYTVNEKQPYAEAVVMMKEIKLFTSVRKQVLKYY